MSNELQRVQPTPPVEGEVSLDDVLRAAESDDEQLAAKPPVDQPISRYLDLARFVSMLESRGLFFTSPDRLGDEHEGKLGAADQQLAFQRARQKYSGLTKAQAFWRWETEV